MANTGMNEGGQAEHKPVMLAQALRMLEPRPGQTIVDGTVGAGGHAAAILRALQPEGLLIALDRDPAMANLARARLAASGGVRVRVYHANYADMDSCLAAVGARAADGILLDLGVASPHLDRPERGFSYRADGPLDMRMTPGEGPSAGDWLNAAPEEEIAAVLREYGEERFARRIARAIVQARKRAPIRRTCELAEIIARAVPRGPRRLHPARRSFQGIRIFINRELDHLERFLRILPDLLAPGGRCVIISYHSLEDRRVKHAFRAGVAQGYYESLTRKPLRPLADEIADNPRSRSARLRAIRKSGGGPT